MWIKTEGNRTHFDRRDAEYLNENCKGIWTKTLYQWNGQPSHQTYTCQISSSAIT